MGRKVHEKNVFVYFLSTEPADTTLVTVTDAEIAAGTLLPDITADGVDVSPTNNRASLELIDTEQIAEYPGTRAIQVNMQFARESLAADDIAWELFEHATEGWLVVSRFGAALSTSTDGGDRVEIYHLRTFEPIPLASAANTFQQYRVETAVENWEQKAEVVAS